MSLRLRHKLTAYHWRHDRRSKTSVIGICSCGWKSRLFRPDFCWTCRDVPPERASA